MTNRLICGLQQHAEAAAQRVAAHHESERAAL
eukprot:COSAG05_NODE_21951_length_268_cov_0.609467_1_plen_31_part_10